MEDWRRGVVGCLVFGGRAGEGGTGVSLSADAGTVQVQHSAVRSLAALQCRDEQVGE